MKTLHNIFHDKLIKRWLLIVISSVFIMYVVGINAGIIKRFSELSSWTYFAALAVGISPFVVFSLNTHFAKNINWLINYNYNRKELISFFFFSQALKILLAVFHFFILFFAFTFFYNPLSGSRNYNIFESYVSSDLFYLYLGLTFVIVVFGVSSLFSANKQEVLRSRVKKMGLKRSLYAYAAVGLGLFLLKSLSDSNIPLFLILSGVVLIAIYASVWTFNRTFRIFRKKENHKFAAVFSIAYIMPLLIVSFFIKADIHNQSIKISQRLTGVNLLGKFSGEFDSQEQISLLRATTSKSEHSELLKVFGKNISLKSALAGVKTDYHALSLLDNLPALDKRNLALVINRMSNFKRMNKLGVDFDSQSFSFFRKQKLDIKDLTDLLNNRDTFKQYAAIYIAKSSLDSSEFISFVATNQNFIDQKLLDSPFLKRWLVEK